MVWEIVSSPHFVYDFSRKIFFMLHFINWPNFIVSLPLILEILGNMCIAIVWFPGCDVINFEISLIFLIKPFFYMTGKLRQKFKYLENEKRFPGQRKSFFISFKGLLVAKSCLRFESASNNFIWQSFRFPHTLFWAIFGKIFYTIKNNIHPFIKSFVNLFVDINLTSLDGSFFRFVWKVDIV